jgi:hypothetical protein
VRGVGPCHAAPLFDERKAIITGKKDVPTFDIPDDGEGELYRSCQHNAYMSHMCNSNITMCATCLHS